MTFEVSEAIPIKYYHGVTGATIAYTVEDEAGNQDSTGNLVENGVIVGLYEGTFTPDAAGFWSVIMTVGTTSLMQTFPVAVGTLSNATSGLVAIHTDVATVITDLAVASADGVANALAGDVVGNKGDAAVVVVGATKSLVAYEKGNLTTALAIKAKTDLIAGATVVAADLATALTTIDLDHITKTDYGVAVPADGSLFDEIMNKDAGQTFSAATDSLEAIQEAIALLSGGALASATAATHTITAANDKTETDVFTVASADVNAFSLFFDLDTLETASEGGTVTFKFYTVIDGAAYSDVPSAKCDYVVGSSGEYPSIEVGMVDGNFKVTIQCSDDVTVNRIISYRYITKQLS